MRRFDKKKNMGKANLLVETRYLESKGESSTTQEIYDALSDNPNNYKVVMSKNPEVNFIPIPTQEPGFKPKGLWYGINTSWIDWVSSEMPSWESEFIHIITLDSSSMLQINNIEELSEFTSIYSYEDGEYINWQEVANKYSGIEINPYIWEARMKFMWYYGWDIASGCVWGNGTLVGSKLITTAEGL
jgi:hypothetical protein